MTQSERSIDTAAYLAMATLFCLGNSYVPWLISNLVASNSFSLFGVALFFLIGILVSEVALLGILIGMGPQWFPIRLCWGVLSCIAVLLTYFIEHRIAVLRPDAPAVPFNVQFVFSGSAFFWLILFSFIAGTVGRMMQCAIGRSHAESAHEPHTFSIRFLFQVTAAVAVLMVLYRLVRLGSFVGWPPGWTQTIAVSALSACIAGIGCWLIPLAVLADPPRLSNWFHILVAVVIGTIVVSVLSSFLLLFIFPPMPRQGMTEFLFYLFRLLLISISFSTGFTLSMVLVLCIWRQRGFRLVSRRHAHSCMPSALCRGF